MNNGLFAACNGVDGPPDQVLPCGRQNLQNLISKLLGGGETGSDLNPHVIRDTITFYEAAHEIKVRVASSRICDLNLLIPTFDEQLKESRFLFNGHGIRKGLIPIPKVCGKPDRRYSRPFGRPLTVLKVEGSIRFVSLRGVNTRKCKSARVCVLKSPKRAPQHARHDRIVADSWCPRNRTG